MGIGVSSERVIHPDDSELNSEQDSQQDDEH